MGKLTVLTRNTVRFDPRDPTHRLYYYQYIRTNRQGECPVRFITVQDDQGNLVHKVQKMLSDYYTGLEFQFHHEKDPNLFKVRSERIIPEEVTDTVGSPADEIPTLTDEIPVLTDQIGKIES